MGDNQEEKEPSFKVVDKRRFTQSGETRQDAPAIDEPPKKKPAPEEAKKHVSESMAQEQAQPGKITFPIFIQSLAQQSLMALGLIPWPHSGLVELKLEQARETIDILGMLKEKTEGNLEPEEQKFFDGLLYELRMTFVQVLQGGSNPDQPQSGLQ